MLTELLAVHSLGEGITQPVVITLFGGLCLTINGKPIKTFRSNKARALLAYLLVTHPRPVLRTTISELLWPDYTNTSALTNLRQTLTNLRDSLAPFALLEADRRQIQLTLDPTTVWWDASEFAALLDACQQHTHATLAQCFICQPRLQQAVALAQGSLLENFPETDSVPFNTWLAEQQAHFATRVAQVQALLAAVKPPLGNLPPPLTSLVGRAEELAELDRKLQHTIYRCVSLVGPGGIGKTRLACAVGEQLGHLFPAGVWLVELGAVTPATAEEPPESVQDRLASTIATALGFALQGPPHPTVQVANYLANKTALLILDSFEQVSASAAWLPILLTAAPHLRLLITTRHRPPLQSQLVHHIEGLAVPPEAVAGRLPANLLIAHYASVQLFVARAQSAQMPLALDPPTLAAISQLCRFVDGSPWAIELAVSLLDQQSPTTILQTLQHNYRALVTSLLDVPARQRSAETVFRTAWQLLTPLEAHTLARCAVFRDGFTLAAAQNVAAATQVTLDALVQKSFLRPTGALRYAMQDLVRQFAGEQLAHDVVAAERSHAVHAAYFTSLLATWQPDDATEQQFRTAVTQDWENVQAAWAWAVAERQVAFLLQGVDGLAEYYEMTGLFYEANQTFGAAIDQVRLWLAADTADASSTPAGLTARQTLLGHLLWHRCYFLNSSLGQTEQAQGLAQELVTWGHQLGDFRSEAHGYYELGLGALLQGDYQRQQTLLLQALPLVQRADDRREEARYLMMLGVSLKMQHAYAAAQPYFEQALVLARALGASRLEILVLNNLGSFHWNAGHFTEAIACFQQVLPRARQLAQKDSETFATACLGALAYTLGDYSAARTALMQVRQGYIKMGDKVLEAQMLTMLGALCAELGEVALAGEYCRLALASSVAQLYTVQREALVTQGHLHQAAGDWCAARAAFETAYTLSQQTNVITEWLPIQAYLAHLDLAQGEIAAALAAVEPVLANFAISPFTPAQRPQELLLIAYQILVANHDQRASAVLDQAWRLVQQHMAQIDDPHLCHTYMSNVPVNRTLVRLVQRQSEL